MDQEMQFQQANQVSPGPGEQQEEHQIEEPPENLNEPLAKNEVPIAPNAPVEQVGFFRRLIGCKCSRGKEIQNENKNEIVTNQEEPTSSQRPAEPPKQDQPNKLDEFLQKLTPIYILSIYYINFLVVIGLMLANFLLQYNPSILKMIGGLYVTSFLLKLLVISFLEEEWFDELEYIDQPSRNKLRNFAIYLSCLFNFDIIYWTYYIYHKPTRDGVIEHMHSLCRLVDIFVLNVPLMLICAWWQLNATEEVSILYSTGAIINLLNISNSLMLVNFFEGTAIKSILWNLSLSSQIYVRVLLLVTLYIVLDEFNAQYIIIGLFVFIGILQFVFFNENDGVPSSILTAIYYQYKSTFIFIFREYSFGMKEIDSGAEPNIFPLSKQVHPLTYSLIQTALNLYGNFLLAAILILFDGVNLIQNDDLLFYLYSGAIGYTSQFKYIQNVINERRIF
ncbi:hypothetical protein pb186bvf_013458 [Paramecium bursaria]